MNDAATHLTSAHKAAYQSERSVRWSMEDNQAMGVIMTFLDVVANRLELPRDRVEVRRLDDYWFDVYSPDKVEWVKGCPDYFGLIFSGNIRFLFFELKIKKNGEFLLTKTGGKTKLGTQISKYGCTSFYLDIVPVLKNMNDFCDNAGLPKDKFLVLFAEPGAGANGINLISLDAINSMIANGWNGMAIQQFGEGYGKPTYLIPREAMTSLTDLTSTQIMGLASERSILPELMVNTAEAQGSSVAGLPAMEVTEQPVVLEHTTTKYSLNSATLEDVHDGLSTLSNKDTEALIHTFIEAWTPDYLLGIQFKDPGSLERLAPFARVLRAVLLNGDTPKILRAIPQATEDDVVAAKALIVKRGWSLSSERSPKES